jgi:hypothetical protein
MGSIAGSLLSIGSSIIGGNSARKGANANAAYNTNALQVSNDVYGQTQDQLNPYLTGGTTAFNQLANMANTGDMSKFYTSPNYQFRLDQGIKGMQNAAAGRGMLNSPRTMQALNDYAQNMASNEYQNYFQNMYNLGTSGQNAANNLGQFGQNYAAQQAGVYQNLGNIYNEKNLATGASNQGILGGIGGLFSDITLKENIKPVGTENGHNVYEFNYIGKPEKYRGVMAQEIQKTNPDAVGMRDGYLTVDYDKIGVKFARA